MDFLTHPVVLTLLVIGLALAAFITEWFPVDLVALMIAISLVVLGLVTPEEGISGFGNSATITVMAMFILSAGIARTGAIQVVQDFLLRWGGTQLTRQIALMGVTVGPITAFINNTAVVAALLPVIEELCRKQNISPSKLLIPLSYVTILGGMLSVIGTSTNVLASGLSQQLGYGEFKLFQFTPLGICTFSIGLIYLTIMAPKLLPARRATSDDLLDKNYGLKDYVSEVVVTPQSNLIGQTLQSTQLQRKFDLDVLELIRGGTHFAQPLGDKVLIANDVLLVRGGRADLLKIREDRGLEIVPDVKFQDELEDLSTGEEGIAEVLILSNSRLVGTTLKELRFRQRYNLTVLAIRRGEELVRDRLNKVRLRFGDLLLVQGPKQSLLGLQTSRELLVLEQRDAETFRQDKAWIAIGIGLGVVILAALDWAPILVSSLIGVVVMVLTGCLRPGEIYGAVRWDVIFLLAGLIPLGIAMEKSGTTEWLASGLVALGSDLSGFWILFFFFVVTSLLTEIISNNAAVVLMIPVAVQVAEALDLNPVAFMYAVTFASSNSFMTPIGYQTNTMVYGAGGYKFMDFVRIGGPMNLMMALITPILIVWLYGL